MGSICASIPHFITLRDSALLYKLKMCGNPVSSQPFEIFPTAFAYFVFLGHNLVLLTIFQTLSLLLYFRGGL